MPHAVKRYRVTVPEEDASVVKWCESQINLSYSMRTLIKDCIARNGYCDITCSEPSSKSPGRPRKQDVSLAEETFRRAETGELYSRQTVSENSSEQQVYRQPAVETKAVMPNADTTEYEPVQQAQPVTNSPVTPPVQSPPVAPAPVMPEPPINNYQNNQSTDNDDEDDMAMFSFNR